MYNFLLLLKTRFKEMSDIGSHIVMAVLYACMFGAVYVLADFLRKMGLAQVLPLTGYFGAVVLTFIVTIIKINETFSGNEDSEFLLSMPISSAVQVFVMFAMMFLNNLAICILIELPAYLVYRKAMQTVVFTAGRWLLGLVLTSLPVCGIAVMIGMVIVLSLVRNPRKNQIVSAICLIFLCIACILVVWFADRIYLAASGQISYEAQSTAAGLVNEICRNFKLSRFYELGIVEGDILYTILFVFMSVIWYMVLLFMHTMAYQSVITALRSPLTYGELTADDLVKRLQERKLSAVIFKKEWNQFIRSRYYLLQCSIGIILGIIVPANFLIAGDMGLKNMPFIVPALCCFFAGCSNSTYCSMSMEGKRHWIIEASPVSAGELKRAKLLLYILIVTPIVIFSGIAMGAAFGMGTIQICISILSAFLYALALAAWGCFIGEKFADYSSESERLTLHRGIPFVAGYLPGVILPIIFILVQIKDVRL